jgi:hypothetical protein
VTPSRPGENSLTIELNHVRIRTLAEEIMTVMRITINGTRAGKELESDSITRQKCPILANMMLMLAIIWLNI